MLPPGKLADKRSAFWVRVQGTISTIDTLLYEEGVRVLEAGVFEKWNKHRA